MTYRRVLLIAEYGSDLLAPFTAARALAPTPDRLVVGVHPPPPFAPRPGAASGLEPEAAPWLDAVRAAAAHVAPIADVAFLPDLHTESVEALLASSSADIVVAGPRPPAMIATLGELRRRRPVAVLWVPPSTVAHHERPLAEVLCVALGVRALGAMAAFLRDHGDPALRVTVLSLAHLSRDELTAGLDVAAVRALVTLAPRLGTTPWRALEEALREHSIDLVVLARLPVPLIRSARWPVPVLVLPPTAMPSRPVRRPLDVADPVALGGVLRVQISVAFGVGRNPPVADQEVAFVSSGRVVATATTRDGEVELPSGIASGALGVFRVEQRPAADPVAAVERQVAVVRPGRRPLVLVDAELSSTGLSALAAASGMDFLAVRLRRTRSCHFFRARLRNAGLEPRVVDASAILDEGDAADVGEALDAVRLARVAVRLSAEGFPVVAIVPIGARAPAASGFAVVRPEDVAGRAWKPPSAGRRLASLAERLDVMTGARRIDGNRIEVELDNAKARKWLLDAIALARHTLHLQTYMADDDDMGREVEAALGGTAARGVTVRVLADSLHGRHGSLGLQNALLGRLSAIPGVELRVAQPIAGLPSLEDLKRRDHRKLVVADGRLALLGGRNIAHEYYRAFDEVEISPATPWRQVPWLDAGARVEGPAVAALEGSFREAWTAAGGASFGVPEPPPAGSTPIRAVVHRGLADAATLEAYLAIVDTARSIVVLVTGFPLVLEIQHALVRALRRGVRVRALFGNVAPTHAGEPFEGDWEAARSAATWLVHSRMDALVAEGAEAYQLAVRGEPGWAPDLGVVYPHVHAKAMSADGRVCAVGSANMDLTGSYWESELLVVVEDERVAATFDDRVDGLVARSVRVDRDDPGWQRLARRREWLHHWPGVLSP
ncbi:MAG TPA: phosphatidylserine/phosphatidylglycerophosphate/cardiolipin synthase family protein [Anaeromyxobacteraceae bacterium]|nr:phosphatidylserine/phosphatidylglycerophosphate/cardiolipin synthase family protein [Anaeromyxobacteraceae bacterium]